MADDTDPVVFEALVTPYRSLSAQGVRRMITAICGVSLVTTSVFWWLGAWPVAGFNGAEILLAVLLLRSHAQFSRQSEVLRLSGGVLEVRRMDARGRESAAQLSAGWLNVTLQERPGRVPGLFVSARGRQIEVARALGEPEKRDLAAALSAAIYRLKNPVFDNPQLRGEIG